MAEKAKNMDSVYAVATIHKVTKLNAAEEADMRNHPYAKRYNNYQGHRVGEDGWLQSGVRWEMALSTRPSRIQDYMVQVIKRTGRKTYLFNVSKQAELAGKRIYFKDATDRRLFSLIEDVFKSHGWECHRYDMIPITPEIREILEIKGVKGMDCDENYVICIEIHGFYDKSKRDSCVDVW